MSLWKLSAGTACVIGKKQIKTDVLPTTAYIMLGEKCRNNCRFCAQSRDSSARADMLSRVTWPEFSGQEAAAAVGAAFAAGQLKRACLQVTKGERSWQTSVEALAALTRTSSVPVCISTDIETVAQAQELIARGADCVSVALDTATAKLYQEVKGGQWLQRWELLKNCAAALPGRVSTHLIVGLGETEQEMISTIATCRDNGIRVGLFAFTPVRGTAWADKQPPAVGHYRRVQLAHYLLKQGYGREIFQYRDGRLTGIALPSEELAAAVAGGKAFETSGCTGCNRPYYNERPGGVMYNYPRPLTPIEVRQALADCQLFLGRKEAMKWRVINSGIGRAADNMAVDEAIIRAHAAGQVPPTLRFYGWQPAAISLGYFQKALAEVDVAECRRQGIEVVRRLTGGRAVLHDAELTYSLVVSETHPLVPPTITGSYRFFCQGLLDGLRALGIDAQMSIPRAAYGQTRRRPASAACFDAPSHYEVIYQGRKLVGSAQVRKGGIILQHGSILLRFNPEQMASLLTLPDQQVKAAVAEMLAKRAVSVVEAANRDIGWEEACQAMAAAFGPALGVELVTDSLTQAEMETARELAAKKYSQDSWNLRR